MILFSAEKRCYIRFVGEPRHGGYLYTTVLKRGSDAWYKDILLKDMRVYA